MPFYHKLGEIPHKRHTQFTKPDGGLYREELLGQRGFSGIQSTLYHLYHPTSLKSAKVIQNERVETVTESSPLQPMHLLAADFKSSGDPITSRTWLMANQDLKLGLATPTEKMNYLFRNSDCDELLFVHWGTGKLRSNFGNLNYRAGDYIVIPVGTTYCIDVEQETRFLCLEAPSRIEVPRRYRNEYGQLLENSPFCERDMRIPQELETHDEKGEFEVRVKTGDKLTGLILDHHPLDTVGWDGFVYPYIFNIEDFEPITGRIHQPPPVHQTFEGGRFVVCSFCPRLFDYHPLSIPVPYNHSNVNSSEVLYYVEGDFMSRTGVQRGAFTLHPAGIPHGPHPGTVESSLGTKVTEELAVMVDTFAPLQLTKAGATLMDSSYLTSWLGGS